MLPPPGRSAVLAPLPLAGADVVGVLQGEGFEEGAVYLSGGERAPSDGVRRYGSWLRSDEPVGKAWSAWYRAKREFYVLVAGYPARDGNALSVEIRARHGGVRIVRLDDRDPGERWHVRRIALRKDEVPGEVRIVAIDGSRGYGGWLGFSEPFRMRTGWTWSLVAMGRLLLTVAVALVLVLGPGFALRAFRSTPTALRTMAMVAVPGTGWLAGTGLLAWALAGVISPRLTVALMSLPVIGMLLLVGLRAGLFPLASPAERRALGFFLVVVAVAVARASWSGGPMGELYGGTVSRTLEVGDRSDSRISYHIVQLVAHGTAPYSDLGAGYFAPWSFSHRGPLAGLAVAPIVLVTGAQVPHEMPDQLWLPFDPEGFAAYRVGMIVLAASTLLVLFGVAKALLGEGAALLAVALAGLSPFVLHEVYFTWPKLVAAGWVLLAFLLVVLGRPAWAGLALGVGFLFHPFVVLILPVLALVCLSPYVPAGRRGGGNTSRLSLPGKSAWVSLTGLLLPVGAVVVGWWLVNLGHFEQSRFIEYLTMADGRPATGPGDWVRWRAVSLANTLLPVYLYLFHASHPAVNVVGGQSPAIVPFFLQYWTTAPFGFGLAGVLLISTQVIRGALACPRAGLVLVVLPLALFGAYWGAAPTGLMREGLHPWVLGIHLFASWSWMRSDRGDVRLGRWQSMLLATRAVEGLAMLLVPTLATGGPVAKGAFYRTDMAMLVVIVMGMTWLAWNGYAVYRSALPFRVPTGGDDRRSHEPRLGPPNGDPAHAGCIITDRPDVMWGTDATRFTTEQDGWC